MPPFSREKMSFRNKLDSRFGFSDHVYTLVAGCDQPVKQPDVVQHSSSVLLDPGEVLRASAAVDQGPLTGPVRTIKQSVTFIEALVSADEIK